MKRPMGTRMGKKPMMSAKQIRPMMKQKTTIKPLPTSRGVGMSNLSAAMNTNRSKMLQSKVSFDQKISQALNKAKKR